jgi:hypothetical protein
MKGFDRYRSPRWQMVPVGGVRYMILRDGAGLTVTSSNPGRATVTEVNLADLPAAGRRPTEAGDRFFRINGAGAGNTQLRAANASGSTVKRLLLGVKNRKTVNITFNFVRDNAGHQTTRNTANTEGWVRTINWIYRGQTNIRIRLKLNRNVTVAQDLGTVVRFTSHLPGVAAAEHEWAVVTATGDPGADMNFFFVWEYEQDGTPHADSTDAGTLTNNCIFEDNAGRQVAETMAHEIGHFLGCGDHYIVARKRELMYGITDTRGIHIPKEDADIMNP